MITESGNATSLLDIANKFITFLQKSNSNTQAWELVDDRLNSWFGATLRIPIGDNDGFYVSLCYQRILEGTYESFARGSYLTEDFALARGATQTSCVSHGIGERQGIELFKDTGELIQIGVHTLFDSGLVMCEQPQITCEEETIRPIECANLCNIVQTIVKDGRVSKFQTTPPRYPGTGCPWLTLSDADVDSEFVADCGLVYYFTKTNYDATITFRTNYKHYYWQLMAFGKFNAFTSQDEYMNPLFVAVGTQALEQAQCDYHIPYSRALGHATGNAYKLSIKNMCLSNSNLLNPTKFNDANFSNFRVLMPNGKWTSLYAHTQTAGIENFFKCPGGEPEYRRYYLLQAPSMYVKNFDCGSPMYYNCENMRDTHRITPYLESPDQPSVTREEKIYIVAGGYGRTYIIGYLPNCFVTWSKDIKEGVYIYNKKRYLAVPNGWVNRNHWYRTFLTKINSLEDAENDYVRDREINAGKFQTRLLIPYGDEEVEV